MTGSFDVVIVGGGAAGCVLANRLSAQSSRSVLLLEAGQDLQPGQEPADIVDTYCTSYYNKAYMWPGLRAHWRTRDTSPPVGFDQGRVMGGGSSVMGMVALRGTPADYEEWEALGAKGWGWRDVLPYFRNLENDLDFRGEFHGDAGPITIRRTGRDEWPPLARTLADWAAERQMPFIADMNGDFRDGFATLPISSTRERRASSALCYLYSTVRARKNLTIIAHARAESLILEGRAAVGLKAIVDGEAREFRAREIILSAGAIQSPALLMRSGIGPASHLQDLGIPIVANRTGVGTNLQNHPLLFVGAHLRPEARQSVSLRPHPVTCFRYSSGLGDSPPSDMYIAAHSKSSWSPLGQQLATFNATIFKPRSRGRVSLGSSRPDDHPRVEFNFVGEEIDLLRLMDGFRRVVDIVTAAPVRALYDAVFPVQFTDRLRLLNQKTTANAWKAGVLARLIDHVPGMGAFAFSRLTSTRTDLASLIADHEALAEHVRRNVGGTYHVAGTCRMGGAEDATAVVDPAGQVHGVGGLRVVDASIMPAVPRGNTNIPTVMVAEKIAAGMVAEKQSAAA